MPRLLKAPWLPYDSLRVSLSLIWHILDKILAKQGLEDIIQISQFLELAFSLRQKCFRTFLYAHIPRHISETGRLNYLIIQKLSIKMLQKSITWALRWRQLVWNKYHHRNNNSGFPNLQVRFQDRLGPKSGLPNLPMCILATTVQFENTFRAIFFVYDGISKNAES